MGWVKITDELPKENGKYKVKVDMNPLPMIVDIQEIEVYYSIFNDNKVFHLPHGAQIREWWKPKAKKILKKKK